MLNFEKVLKIEFTKIKWTFSNFFNYKFLYKKQNYTKKQNS